MVREGASRNSSSSGCGRSSERNVEDQEEIDWLPLGLPSPRSVRSQSHGNSRRSDAKVLSRTFSSSSLSNCQQANACEMGIDNQTVVQIQDPKAPITSTASASASAFTDSHDAVYFSRAHVIRLVRRHWQLVFYLTTCFSLLVVLFYLSFFGARIHDSSVSVTDMESSLPDFIGCREWAFAPGDCGNWGIDCQPFESKWMAFRCPTRCAVDQSSALAVYGTGIYRADSRICRAAIHAGVISGNGGCALMRYTGARNSFVGSSKHGVTSKDFNSWFPKTVEFRAANSLLCTDLSYLILVVAVVAFMGLAWFNHTQPLLLFVLLMIWGFCYVRMIGQPNGVYYTDIVIRLLSDVYVVVAVCLMVFFLGPIHTFKSFQHKTRRQRLVFWSVCYVLPFHLLLHMNYVAFVPWLNIDIGGFEKGNVNAGTYVVYGLVASVILYGAIWLGLQVYRQSLWRLYLVGYVALITELFVSWLLFPSTSFHLHHVMIGVFLVPMTRFPSKRAAVAQAMLLGVFIQGYAAWGWSTFLETEPTYMTIPVLETPARVVNVTTTSTELTWNRLEGVDGYSVLLNYVEVYRGINNWTTVSPLQPNLTYFVHVRGVAGWGTNGGKSPVMNFTTSCC